MEYLIYYTYPMPIVFIAMLIIMVRGGNKDAKFGTGKQRFKMEATIVLLLTIAWPLIIYLCAQYFKKEE